MLRVQRSVETAYSQVNYLAQDMLEDSAAEVGAAGSSSGLALDAFQRAESEAEGALKRGIAEGAERSAAKRLAMASGEEEEDLMIRQRPVPAAVFGSAVSST